ncbi:MAG: PTS transporter subunit EIIC [Anaerocolumna sp.]
MSKVSYKQMANEILELLQGADNVDSFLHCMTRLRVTPVDEEKIDLNQINKLSYVIKVQVIAGVIQIVLGPTTVDAVHDEFAKLIGKDGDSIDENIDKELFKQSFGIRIVSALQAILLPAVGVLGGVALINALATILILIGFATDNPYIVLLQTMGGIVTGSLGLYLGFNASKYFGGSPFIGVTLALFIYSPAITGVEYLGMTLSQGVGGVIGIVAIAIIAAKIEVNLKKFIKKEFQLVLIPFLTILITMIPMLLVIIPITSLLTIIITKIITFALYSNDIVFVLANAVLGGTWPLLVMSGLHITVIGAIIPIATETGISPLQVNFVMAAAALIGLTLAVLRAEKENSEVKEIGISGILTALTGITEPLLYGIAMPRLRSLIYVVAGGFAGGLVNGLAHVETLFPASTGIFMVFTLVDIKSQWLFFILAWLVAGSVSFLLFTFFPVKPKEDVQ